jgi:hypothetical protein
VLKSNNYIRRENAEDHAEEEIFEIQPIIVGGSPTDPANKTFLTREQHIEAVRYWNRIIRKLRQQEKAAIKGRFRG